MKVLVINCGSSSLKYQVLEMETEELLCKQTDEAKKKKLLNDAIAPLDKCLAEFPETTQREKVESNRKFIEKELAK